ncbi:MAG TPA: SusC/RagA family TonB-linked outer membrane protein [Prolixibacteraceae bacterium]|nr:SusC/RagA family TonB-linked outer membrane protein [Marinilabiliales bacterium]HBL78348.1 SusC/RagA family TonB-linked outer membrane protein [Prolixibacteraceae bacterium]HCU60046.1 SusC/RagA family TonB-linked outer membrane protein [Prolixibacteraceae bacterium]
MRLTFIFVFVGLMQVSANLYSQSTKLNLNLQNTRLEDVLQVIEQQSEFRFAYSAEYIDLDKQVSIDLKNKQITDVLDALFKGSEIKYRIDNRHIMLYTNESVVEQAVQSVKNLSGTAKSVTGEPLPGVTVVVKGTTNGTITNNDGNYTLTNVPADATLIFSFVGMRSQEIPVAGQLIVNVRMEEESIGIEEVVAIGYGTVKKQDLTGAVASVGGAAISERKTMRVSQALQGSMPGLMVTRSSSAADASATIRVRGITTISDSNPLIIVDGIPGTLDWINPDDIESLSVLKDAASASIYGSRAAAGVILVTTKRAKTGQLSLDYNYEYGIDKPTRLTEHADAQTYMKVLNERNWNDAGNVAGNEFPIYSEATINNYASLNAENPDLYPITDWQDLILNDFSTRQSHKLTLTAGSKNIRTKFSIDYSQSGFLYDGRSYDRILLRANNDVIINDMLSVSVDLNGIYSTNESPGRDFSPNPASYGVAPIYAAMWSDGRIGEGKSGENPYAQTKFGGFSKAVSNSFGGKISIDFSPLKELKISAIVSPQKYASKDKTFVRQLVYTNYDDPNFNAGYITGATQTKLTESRPDNYSITAQLIANYVKAFGKHNLNVMGGYENYYYFSESLKAYRENYILTSFPYLDLGNENYQFNNGSAYENAYRSGFGRVMYNYNNRYFIQANARYDASSRFASEYRWGMFPSFSAGWAISEEAFMKNIPWLSYLKLRASWGSLGNERIGNYPYQSTIGFGNTLIYQGGAIVSGQSAAVSQYSIRDISWETTESYDFGLDASFFDNKLRLTGDYYKKTTKDMLLDLEIPDYIGLENPSQNTGKMNTNGWELVLGWNDKIGDLRYSASVNLSDFKSVMGDLGGTQFLGSQVKFEGSEFNEWYGYKTDGIFQTQEDVNNSAKLNNNVKPGDIKLLDISGPDGLPDGKISSEYDRVLLGGSLPRYLYGGNIQLAYKNFDFSMVFQGIGKQTAQLTQSMTKPFINEYIEVPQLIVGNYWSKYNTDEQNLKAKYPRVSNTGNNNNYSFSDFWLFDGSYFRLKNVALGYNLPKVVTEKIKMQNVKVYASISDLLSIDNYPKGWDPEASSYWVTTSFIFGVSVKF